MKCDVLIVGAGLAGSSLAAALRSSGLDTLLIDADQPNDSAGTEWDSRIYAISPGSREFLHSIGAWPRIPAERVQPVEAMQVFGDGPRSEIVFSAYDCGLPELCHIVESRELHRAIAAVNAEPGSATQLFGCAPDALAIDEQFAVVDLADARSIEARLVIGADGTNSWVRESAGIESHLRAYGQQGVVANFRAEIDHARTARQWFLRDSVLALLPLPGNCVSLVWSTADSMAARLLALPAGEFEREVAAACHFALGELRLLAPSRSFPLQLLRVEDVVHPRLALVGDAAHGVHPLAGQGLNLGFRDANELGKVLCDRGLQDDCGDFRLLRRYARARRESVALMQWTTDGLQRLFEQRMPGARWLRNAGLRFTNTVVPLKNVLIEHALA